MKQFLTIFVLSWLAIFHIQHAFGQDTGKTQPAKSTTSDPESEDSGDKQENKKPVKKKKATIKQPNFVVGIEAGVNDAKMNYFYYSNNDKLGGRIGMVAEFRLSPRLFLQPGLFYAMNGCTGTNDYKNTSDVTIVSVNSIELPFNALIKLGRRNQFIVGGGFYISDNVSANASSALKIGSANGDNLKAIDYGLGICIGHQAPKGFFFKARFQKGIANLNPNGGSITTACFNIDFGFLFGMHSKHKLRRNASDEDLEMRR